MTEPRSELLLPSLFQSSDEASLRGQKNNRRLLGAELSLVVAAAVFGMAVLPIGDFDLFGGLGALALLGAVIVGLVRASARPEEKWYRGRAAAESVKSLSWLYAVGGDPFPLGNGDADERFLARVGEILDIVGDVAAPDQEVGRAQLTADMRALRATPLRERMERYREGRVDDQIGWYSRRAKAHQSTVKKWTAIIVLAYVLGFVGGGARFIGLIPLDLVGLAAAIAGVSIAWVQMQDYRRIAAAYSLAEQELRIVRDGLDGVTGEDDWAEFVSYAESAISREHTMWLARNGQRVLLRS